MKIDDIFFVVIMVIANVIDNSVLLIAIYVFINEYEVREIS